MKQKRKLAKYLIAFSLLLISFNQTFPFSLGEWWNLFEWPGIIYRYIPYLMIWIAFFKLIDWAGKD